MVWQDYSQKTVDVHQNVTFFSSLKHYFPDLKYFRENFGIRNDLLKGSVGTSIISMFQLLIICLLGNKCDIIHGWFLKINIWEQILNIVYEVAYYFFFQNHNLSYHLIFHHVVPVRLQCLLVRQQPIHGPTRAVWLPWFSVRD